MTRVHRLAWPLAPRTLGLLGLLVLVLLQLGSCASPPDGEVRLAEIVRALPGGDPPWLRDDDAAGVRVRRAGGGEVPAHAGMRLARGDVVVTAPGVAAVLHIGGRGEVVLDEDTAVRIGSLEVLFGRLFADLRGLFTVRSATLEAVNEGTRYLFEVARGGQVRVVVAEGALTCRSMRGAWPDLRLTAGQALVYPGRELPRIQRGDPADVDAPLRSISRAPRAGWCCQIPGRPVVRSLEDRCRGAFHPSQDAAEARCRPLPPPPEPPPSGWCCAGQKQPIESTRERCEARKGTYYPSESAARQRCGTLR